MRIAMVCDFFFPQAGGIEIHILQVAKHLIARGHHVIVVTHSYGDRSGVRYMKNGLKVYYVPFLVVYRESTFPTVFSFFPIFRQIMLRERIEIVHGHGSMSSMCHEAIVHGRTMGLATVFTDHSLFEFSNLGSILVNKLMKFTMTDVDHVICVSNTCRENTVLRSALDPHKTSVIPNAVVSEEFEPLGMRSSVVEVTQENTSCCTGSCKESCTEGNEQMNGTETNGYMETDGRILRDNDRENNRRKSSNRRENNFFSEKWNSPEPDLNDDTNRNKNEDTQKSPSPTKSDSTSLSDHPSTCDSLNIADLIPSLPSPDMLTIVVCSRLYANKGADLLVSVIPQVCAADPKLRVLIAGNGPKIVDLQQMCEQHSLQDRVHLIGAIRHDQVRDFMVCGQIYLHATLTEAFGTVIVEAASCGLLVVTTNVGGIPEVLPGHMTIYADPAARQLTRATLQAVDMLRRGQVDPKSFHSEIKQMYHWQDVAVRTEKVYERVMRSNLSTTDTLLDRMQRHYQCGVWAGKLFVLCIVVDTLLLYVLNLLQPATNIDQVPDWSAHDRTVTGCDAGFQNDDEVRITTEKVVDIT